MVLANEHHFFCTPYCTWLVSWQCFYLFLIEKENIAIFAPVFIYWLKKIELVCFLIFLYLRQLINV